MSAPLHPTLIKANIALYKGERAEALRLIQQYDNERQATDDPHRSMVLWLAAQSQTDDAVRADMLRDLIGEVPAEDPYGRLARDYLSSEEIYSVSPESGGSARYWIGGGAVVTVLLVILTVVLMRPRGAQSGVTDDVNPTAPAVTATVPPDRSQRLVAESFTLRYERGIFRLISVEDRSERVIDAVTGEPIEPVAGARFYALEMTFECRSGICNDPPEAELTLLTDNNEVILIREDVTIAGQGQLQPIALGRATTGWIVFELPALSLPDTLFVEPFEAAQDATPLTIALP